MRPSTIRWCGIAIALGGIAWSIGWLQAGVRPIGPTGEPINDQIEIWMSGLFQVGLLALLFAMRSTFATGFGRFGRWAINVEIGALILAIGWTIPFLFDANREHNLMLTLLDAFWPLSMLGKIIIGILVIRARVWPSPVRYLPLTASMLFPIYILVEVVGFSDWGQIIVRAAYFGVVHALLGYFVARQVPPLATEMESTREAYLRSQGA